MSTERAFLFLLAANAAAALLYLLYGLALKPLLSGRKKEDYSKLKFVFYALIMLLCPVVGIAFLVISFLLLHILFHREVDISDVIFSKERVKEAKKADPDREMNVVPLEEALAISNQQDLRALLLNVIRSDDSRQSLPAIAMALNSSDSETSHFAASVLSDALNDFRAQTQKMVTKICGAAEKAEKENAASSKCKIDLEDCISLLTSMNNVLKGKILSAVEQVDMVHKMEEVCEAFYRYRRENMESQFYEWISLRLLGIGDFAEAEKWGRRSMEDYPEELSSYTALLKVYFAKQDREHFFSLLKQLKNSSIVIDSQTLNLIRTFS